METKEEVKQKQVKSAIDYRRYYINYMLDCIDDNLKRLREVNDMPENLVREKIIEDRREWAIIEEKNRELSNEELKGSD